MIDDEETSSVVGDECSALMKSIADGEMGEDGILHQMGDPKGVSMSGRVEEVFSERGFSKVGVWFAGGDSMERVLSSEGVWFGDKE